MSEEIVQASGKRRRAVARARITKSKNGKRVIRINGVPLHLLKPRFSRIKIEEPLILAQEFIPEDIDIKVDVKGGGFVSRAEAVRMAIARGLDKYLKLNEVRQIFENYDRTMIAGDIRRTEPKKAGGRGARTRFQKSYR